MSQKLIASPKPTVKSKGKDKAEQVGGCVVCKCCIFSDQQYGRAPKPLLGKAHTWCGGEVA